MAGRLHGPRDPFWDDGTGARRTNRRVHFDGLIAFALALAAVGLTAAMWLRTLAPLAMSFGLN